MAKKIVDSNLEVKDNLTILGDATFYKKIIKSGSSDSYMLLGGGGTKALSDFQTAGNYVTTDTTQTISAEKTFTNNITRFKYLTDGSYLDVSGYGLMFNRGSNYLRPDTNGTKDLFIGDSTKGQRDWRNINLYGNGVFRYNDYSIWHTGNLTPGDYVKKAGDTMSGKLNIHKTLLDTESQWLLQVLTNGSNHSGFWMSANDAHLYLRRKDAHVGVLLKPEATSTFTHAVQAASFIKSGSSDSYMLLGGGGTKALSDFATSGHTHNYVSRTGDSMDYNKLSAFEIASGPEDNAAANPSFINDLGHLVRRGGSVAVTTPTGYSLINPDAMFEGSGAYTRVDAVDMPIVFEVTFPSDAIMRYSGRVGIAFGSLGFRAKDVKIEQLVGTTWTTLVNVTGSAETSHSAALSGAGSTGVSKLRVTLASPYSSTGHIRIIHLWGFAYNSPMGKTLFLSREGGSMYGNTNWTTGYPQVNGTNVALSSTSISVGTGLSGGGSLAANRTISFDTTWGDGRYAPKSHLHDQLDNHNETLLSATYGSYGGFINTHSITNGNPTDHWYHRVKMLHNNSAGYYTELAVQMTGGNSLWYKRYENGADQGWKQVWDNANLDPVTIDTTQTITGEKHFVSKQLHLSSHLFRKMYSATEVYDHYYPSGGNGTNHSAANLRVWDGGTSFKVLRFSGDGGFQWNGNNVWHAGNDGAGSGLDADLLDGQHASAFASSTHSHEELMTSSAGDLNTTRTDYASRLTYHRFSSTAANQTFAVNNANGVLTMQSHSGTGAYGKQIAFTDNDNLYMRSMYSGGFRVWREILHTGNHIHRNDSENDARYIKAASESRQIRTDTNTSGASLITTGSGSNFQVVHDGTSTLELKNSAGGGIRINSLFHTNAGLKVDGSLNSSRGLFTIGSKGDRGMKRIVNPEGAAYSTTTSSVGGAIKITLPFWYTSTMMRMTVKVYEYTTDESFTLEVGGYNYGSNLSWINPFAQIIGSKTDRDFNVRFGNDGSNVCIWIGETSSTWSYPNVAVTEFIAGFANENSSWENGWNISFVTAFATTDAIQTTMGANLPASDWNKLKNIPYSKEAHQFSWGSLANGTKYYIGTVDVGGNGSSGGFSFELPLQGGSIAGVIQVSSLNGTATPYLNITSPSVRPTILLAKRRADASIIDFYIDPGQTVYYTPRATVISHGNYSNSAPATPTTWDYTWNLNRIGIGTISPTEALEVNGNVKAHKLYSTQATTSLRKLKKNIKPFEKSGLELVNATPTYRFDYKKEEMGKDMVGTMYEEAPEELQMDGMAINMYNAQFIAYKAIQELSEKVEKQQKQIDQLLKIIEDGQGK